MVEVEFRVPNGKAFFIKRRSAIQLASKTNGRAAPLRSKDAICRMFSHIIFRDYPNTTLTRSLSPAGRAPPVDVNFVDLVRNAGLYWDVAGRSSDLRHIPS